MCRNNFLKKKDGFFDCFYNKIVSFFSLKLYTKHLLKTFTIDYVLWFLVFFLILFAFKQMDANDNYGLARNLIISITRAGWRMMKMLNIVSLICCIFYFIRIQKSFNFFVIEAFGLSSKQILKPIIIFLVFASILKTFVLMPATVKLENARQTFYLSLKSEQIALKQGAKFSFIDGKNANNYNIVSGSYYMHRSNFFDARDVVVLCYKNSLLKDVYSARKALLVDGQWNMLDVNHTSADEDKNYSIFLQKASLKSLLNVKELIMEIKNSEKIRKDFELDIYDHYKYLTKLHKTNIKNELIEQARLYLYNEIISFFGTILCCLMAFFFCVSSTRSRNFVKVSLKCFVLYFAFFRLLHLFENLVKISTFGTFCVCMLLVLVCILFYLFILDKDRGFVGLKQIRYLLLHR